MKRLSVIIPMFKVEPYLGRCIRSIEEQNIPIEDFEILCINDGSPDNCRNIVLELQKDFENIILFDQENKGVSSARNKGISNAAGKYMIFIDPDDYVEGNCFERILYKADCCLAQVSFLGFEVVSENGIVQKKVFNEVHSKGVFNGIEAYHISRGDGKTDPDRAWAVLLESEFVKSRKLEFLVGVPYLEDGELISRILCLAERCIFDGRSFYKRTIRLGSATNSGLFKTDKARIGFLTCAVNLKKFQQTDGLTELQYEFLNQPICKFVLLVIYSSKEIRRLDRLIQANRMLKEAGFNKLNLNSVDKEFTRLGILYNRSIILLLIYEFILRTKRFFKIRFNSMIHASREPVRIE